MGISRPVMEVYSFAWAYFVPFVLLSSFVVMNVVVGIEQAGDDQRYGDPASEPCPCRRRGLALIRIQAEQYPVDRGALDKVALRIADHRDEQGERGAGFGGPDGMQGGMMQGGMMGQPQQQQPQPQPTAPAADDPMAKLQKLKQMLDMGLISQQDFDAKKQDIINSI